MKKIFALALSLILLASTGTAALAAPGAAAPATTEGTMTERLKAITLKVKDTLGIGDSFTSFNGNLNETGTGSLWSLSWSSDREQLYVSANENGTVVSYNDYLPGIMMPPYSRIPRFPAMNLDDAKTAANTFLAKVLDPNRETVDLNGTSSLDYTGNAMYYLNGQLKLNGIDTPVYISVSVSASTKQVASFYRGDSGQGYSGAADPSAAGDKVLAAAALKSTLNMKLTYALQGDGTHTARLQYTPAPNGSFVVDAATGKLVDLSKLNYNDLKNPLANKSADAMATGSAGSGASITPTEQATIDQLQGVLPQSALESAVRSYPELGLTDFNLQNVSYYTYQDENKKTQVTANLQFSCTPKDETAKYLYVTMDARTGKISSVNGNIIFYTGEKKTAESADYKYPNAQTEAVARSFAGKILPDELAQAVLSADVSSPDGSSVRNYAFYRTHENIPFPENYISVSVDAETGYVVSFNYNWYAYDVTFVPQAGAITADTAAAKYSDGAGTALSYVAVPTSFQPSGLLLAYTTADRNVWGVNATTGELLKATGTEPGTELKYDDIEGNSYAAMIEKLASFGIGFPAGSFKPDAELIQEDALILIESTNGRKVVPLVGVSVSDDIYNMAYSMGILTPDEKNPSKPITRGEFVKYLVNALGYKEIAGLQGIFDPGFVDDASIPAGLNGYIALGRGFGIIRGDQNGYCNAGATATRVQAAIMLYNCMSRK